MNTTIGRIRCCGDCLAGEHDIDTENWRTDYLWLVRSKCVCRDCDCTFVRAHIEHPRFDQRHYQPCVRGRRRRRSWTR
jgi:hypothetical protein